MSVPRPGAAGAFEPSDQEAAPAANGGAGCEVHELYRTYSPSLVRQLTASTRCPDVARDLVHEAFVRLLGMTPARFARIEQPAAYLQRISSNLARDLGRARALAERHRPGLEAGAGELVDQVTVLEAHDTLRRLEQALGRLAPRTREIFIAQRIEGLSYAEIAERTGLSIKGVEKQMSKAIAKIDRLLDRA